MQSLSSVTGFSYSSNSLHNLYARQLCLDPILHLPVFKQSRYYSKVFVQRLQLERELKEHQGCVNCINFSASGELLLSGSDDLHVVLWDWTRGRVAGKYPSGHVSNVFQAKFMPYTEDRVLVTAARDGQIRLLVLSSTGEQVHTKRVGHHSDSAHKVKHVSGDNSKQQQQISVQPDSPHVFLSCGEDGSVLEVDLREEKKRNKLLVCKNQKNMRVPLYSIFIDPSENSYFAVSGRDQFARIYDRRLLKEGNGSRVDPVKVFCPHHLENPNSERANITCLVYSHDGKELLCSYNDEDIYLFDASHSSGSEYIKKYSGHRNSATVKGVNFYGLRSEYVVSGSDCGHVFLWDKETQEIVQWLEADQGGVVNCLEPHPHIPVLATSGLDHDIKLFSPTAPHTTTLDGLDEAVKKNTLDRTEARNTPTDSLELLMEFIVRQYRIGVRQEIGIPHDSIESSGSDEDSSSSSSDSEHQDGRGHDYQ